MLPFCMPRARNCTPYCPSWHGRHADAACCLTRELGLPGFQLALCWHCCAMQNCQKQGFSRDLAEPVCVWLSPRQDNRMMEMNAVLNRLLAKSPDSRRRNLHLRRCAACCCPEPSAGSGRRF